MQGWKGTLATGRRAALVCTFSLLPSKAQLPAHSAYKSESDCRSLLTWEAEAGSCSIGEQLVFEIAVALEVREGEEMLPPTVTTAGLRGAHLHWGDLWGQRSQGTVRTGCPQQD